jgi:hypothetical protein
VCLEPDYASADFETDAEPNGFDCADPDADCEAIRPSLTIKDRTYIDDR